MLALSPRTYLKDECRGKFNLLHFFHRTLTCGIDAKESAYFTRNADGKAEMHIYFHKKTDERRWGDDCGDDYTRFYDCDLDTFADHIGLMAFYGEISEADWRKMDEFVWKETRCGIEY